VLRFTWRDLTERSEHVVATITSILAGWTGDEGRDAEYRR